jgi:hypothetical protein
MEGPRIGAWPPLLARTGLPDAAPLTFKTTRVFACGAPFVVIELTHAAGAPFPGMASKTEGLKK